MNCSGCEAFYKSNLKPGEKRECYMCNKPLEKLENPFKDLFGKKY